jgi:hypothetical protein|tara:strand:- start:47 stop:691 length:645 start_codon:yes stop_codon:yes gene_type:complete
MSDKLITYNFSKPYTLSLIKNEYYHNIIAEYYETLEKYHKPINRSVTYLVWSGISFPAFKQTKFPTIMTSSYSMAFNVHQKPHSTFSIHKKYIEEYSYFNYLIFIAFPVDVYAHIMQFVWGEQNDFLLEGGAFFIPYQISHWILLVATVMSPYVYRYSPQITWKIYFSTIYYMLVVHDNIYRLTLRRLSLTRRISEFVLFCLFSYSITNNYLLL